MSKQPTRLVSRSSGSLNRRLCIGACALMASAVCGVGAARSTAHNAEAVPARTLEVADTAHLHSVKSPGSELVEEGKATGQLPGTVKVDMNVGATVAAKFTILTKHGSISGNGSGKLHSSGQYASFGGTMTVSHGTGQYAHAHGHGGFYGTINRKTYAVVVQTTGSLSY